MEMERPWPLVGCSGVVGLPELERGLMGERASLSVWGSELQEPESDLRSPPGGKERRKAHVSMYNTHHHTLQTLVKYYLFVKLMYECMYYNLI